MLVAALSDSGREVLWAESVMAQGAVVGPELAMTEALDSPLSTLDGRLGRATDPTCEVIVPARSYGDGE